MKLMKKYLYILFLFLNFTSYGQILKCVDSNDLVNMTNYIENSALNGLISQMNMIGSDRYIKNNKSLREEANKSFISSYFLDSSSLYFNTLIPTPKNEFRSIQNFLIDLNIFHGNDTVHFDLSDAKCIPVLYRGKLENETKSFMYMIMTGMLTTEVKNDKKDLYILKFDTVAIFFRISAINDPASNFHAHLNQENIKIWQVINKNLIKELRDIIPQCDYNQIAAYIPGSESEETMEMASFGEIDFRTDPFDASIKFEGIPYVFTSPIIESKFTVNKFAVNVSKPGYFQKDTTITISAYRKNNIFIKLTPKEGKLTLKCNPLPDELYIDGKKLAFPTASIPLQAGKHTIMIQKQFYNDTLFGVEVEADLVKTVNINLSNKMGTLKIYTTDNTAVGSYFTIESTKYFEAPFDPMHQGSMSIPVKQGYIGIKFIRYPWLSCNVYKEGYFEYIDTVLVDSFEPEIIDVKLTPYRTALIKTKPQIPGLKLYVDGKYYECAEVRYIPLSVGSHEFLFIDGNTKYPFTHYVEPKTNKIKFKLNQNK
jgi:hypothetical protein